MKRTTDPDDVVPRQEARDLVSGHGAGESQVLSDAVGIWDLQVEPHGKRCRFVAAHKRKS